MSFHGIPDYRETKYVVHGSSVLKMKQILPNFNSRYFVKLLKKLFKFNKIEPSTYQHRHVGSVCLDSHVVVRINYCADLLVRQNVAARSIRRGGRWLNCRCSWMSCSDCGFCCGFRCCRTFCRSCHV